MITDEEIRHVMDAHCYIDGYGNWLLDEYGFARAIYQLSSHRQRELDAACCRNERVESDMTGCETDMAYNMALTHAEKAIIANTGDLKEDCDRAYDALQEARDALSELV